MTEAGKRDEDGTQGLGELPRDLEVRGERDEIAGWALRAGDAGDSLPGADVIARETAPVTRERAAVALDSSPVFQLLPRSANRLNLSSESAGEAAASLVLGRPWRFEWVNQTGSVVIVTEVITRLLPLLDGLLPTDVLLTIEIDGRPAYGLQRFPVGQMSQLACHAEIRPYHRLVVVLDTPAAPALLPAPSWSARSGFGFAVYGGSVWMVAGQDGSGYVQAVWTSGNGGRSWSKLPDVPWAAEVAVDEVVCLVALPKMLVAGIWGTDAIQRFYGTTDGLSWVLLADNTSFFVTSSQAMTLHDGLLVALSTNVDGQVVTNVSPDGVTWTETLSPANTLDTSASTGAGNCALSFGGALYFTPWSIAGQALWLRSVDMGKSWVALSGNSPEVHHFIRLVRGGRVWMCGGEGPGPSNTPTTNVFYSDDMVNWVGPFVPPWSAATGFGLVAQHEAMVEWGGSDAAGALLSSVYGGGVMDVTGPVPLHASSDVSGIMLPERSWS